MTTCKRCGRQLDESMETLSYRVDTPGVGIIGGYQKLCNLCLSDFNAFMKNGNPKERIVLYLGKWKSLHPSVGTVVQDMEKHDIPKEITIQSIQELVKEGRVKLTLADDGATEVSIR